MTLEDVTLSEQSQSQKDNYSVFLLEEQNVGGQLPEAEGTVEWGVAVQWCSFSLERWKVGELDGGGRRSTIKRT